MNKRIHVKTFEEAANIVADDFIRTMQEEGFSSWKEMVKCYWWEPEDIREEISYILDRYTDVWMWDDGTHVQIDLNDMYYKDFKKMVIQKISERMKA